MEQSFIRIGTVHLNVDHIAYVRQGRQGLEIVTTVRNKDGSPRRFVAKGENANKVLDALQPFASLVDVDIVEPK